MEHELLNVFLLVKMINNQVLTKRRTKGPLPGEGSKFFISALINIRFWAL